MSAKLLHRACVLAVLWISIAPTDGTAQMTAELVPEPARGHDFTLSIKNIMQGPENVGESPQGVAWTDDSEWIYFRWRPAGGDWHDSRDLYRVSARGGQPERIPDEVADTIGINFGGGDVSEDGRFRIRSSGGDLYLIDRRSGSRTRLTETTATEDGARFSSDGTGVFYTQSNNVFRMDIESGRVRQLTDIRSQPAPRDEPDPEGHRAFLEDQQAELFEHIRVDRLREEERDAARERREALGLKPQHLGEGERVQRVDVNPSGTHVVLQTSRPARGTLSTIVPDWVTESGYTQDLNVRTKVGDGQSELRTGLLDVDTGDVEWIDLWPAEETDTEDNGGGSEPALAGGGFRGWNDSGTHALVAAIAFDYKEWRLYALDASSGELTLLDSVEDEAWVGGPCFSFQGPCMGWIPGTDRAWYVSEETGWAHVYTVNADGSDQRALTSGEWEVRGISIPDGWDRFLMHTSESSAFNTQPWTMKFDGSDRELLLEGEGNMQVTPSPDGERLAVVYSRSNRPAELFVAENRRGASLEQVTTSPTDEWLAFPWKEAEIVHFEAEDGTMVPARIYRPSDVGAEPNGAGVVFVHGAGYLQNVHNGWSGYYREYQFHHLLAAQGYVVLDIDYRGSAGHGRNWRTATYRWMGGKDLSDQVDGARYLIEHEGVDAGRLGIYGGSYGGFITLMALFTAPGTFEAGAALRSVTDWAHYNHWYTSRILNQPHDDEEAYRKSSPIYFAEDFDGHLLIAHGMVDTNVHFSDVVRLAQRLIELGKENWEMAVYPVEGHGFAEPSSWTDEYRRIYELFERAIGQ